MMRSLLLGSRSKICIAESICHIDSAIQISVPFDPQRQPGLQSTTPLVSVAAAHGHTTAPAIKALSTAASNATASTSETDQNVLVTTSTDDPSNGVSVAQSV